jgi:DNA-binding MarR family transcriptional regulator
MADDRRLLYLLRHAARAALAHASARTEAAAGASVAQLGALSHVAAYPGATPTDVAGALDLNKSGTSTLVVRLEKAGLLRREPNPADARGVRLFATKKGEATRERARPAFRRAVADIMEGFSASEMDVVYRFLNALVERFGRAANQEL